jgi:hypothetical protein
MPRGGFGAGPAVAPEDPALPPALSSGTRLSLCGARGSGPPPSGTPLSLIAPPSTAPIAPRRAPVAPLRAWPLRRRPPSAHGPSGAGSAEGCLSDEATGPPFRVPVSHPFPVRILNLIPRRWFSLGQDHGGEGDFPADSAHLTLRRAGACQNGATPGAEAGDGGRSRGRGPKPEAGAGAGTEGETGPGKAGQGAKRMIHASRGSGKSGKKSGREEEVQ